MISKHLGQACSLYEALEAALKPADRSLQSSSGGFIQCPAFCNGMIRTCIYAQLLILKLVNAEFCDVVQHMCEACSTIHTWAHRLTQLLYL